MKRIKFFVIFLIVIGVMFWALDAIYFKSSQKSKASGETMNLYLSPSASTTVLQANQDFTVTLMTMPSTNAMLRGYKTKVNFDKTKLILKSITYKTGQVVQGLGQTASDIATINGAAFGQVNLVGEITTSTGSSLTSATGVGLVELIFTNIGTSGTTLSIIDSTLYTINSDMTLFDGWVVAQENLAVNGGGVLPSIGVTGVIAISGAITATPVPSITDTVTPIPTATPAVVIVTSTPTPTPVPSDGNTVLNMKLKFQGINKLPAAGQNSMVVKVKLRIEGTDNSPDDFVAPVTFVANDQGIWSGTFNFGINDIPGRRWTVYVKGPRHLQKKVCIATPTETASGTYRCSNGSITLVSGDNNLDLSGILLLSGDIYGPDKIQDSIVNSIDISFIRNNLNKTDAATLAVCDINLDSKCDTQDYSLVINSLLIKTDEQ